MHQMKWPGRFTIPVRLIIFLASSGVGLTCAPAIDLPPLNVPDGCQPLAPSLDCRLPYPSDYFRIPVPGEDDTYKLSFRAEAKPLTRQEYSADFTDWKPVDGFSRTPVLMALLGHELSTENFVGALDDYEKSARPQSPTWIIDSVSGEFVPHFVELDARAEHPERQALLLHPMQPLHESRRYIVSLHGLMRSDGSPALAPEGFRRLRDRVVGSETVLENIAQRFETDVFAPLERLGLKRESIQLAWDFTTGRDDVVMHDMLRARTLTLQALEAEAPRVSIFEVDTTPDTNGVWKKIRGVYDAPLFLSHDDPGAAFVRNVDGEVELQGQVEVPFTLIVPDCVRDQYTPRPLVQYGHGFFYNQKEIDQDKSAAILNAVCAVGVAIDWWGMSSEDLGPLLAAIGEQVWETPAFTERVQQAMMNWLALTYAFEGNLAGIDALHRPTEPGATGVQTDPENPMLNNAGALLFQQGEVHFLGISMGHILGGTYAALNPKLTRIVFHVGGAGFSRIMYRALPFEPLLAIMGSAVSDPVDQQWMTAQLQRYLDTIDPTTWAPYVLKSELPEGPANGFSSKKVLLQFGLGDTSVPNISSLYHGRLLGLDAVGPQPLALFDMQQLEAPHEGSGLAGFDMGVDVSFSKSNAPLRESTTTHNDLRSQAPVQRQIAEFLQQGRIIHPCEGVCLLDP